MLWAGIPCSMGRNTVKSHKPTRGGHWGIPETAKREKNSSKTANKIGQNRKPHTKLYNQTGPNRKKRKEKPKTTLGTKTEKPLAFFTKTENQMLKNEKSAIRIEHQNRKTEVFYILRIQTLPIVMVRIF